VSWAGGTARADLHEAMTADLGRTGAAGGLLGREEIRQEVEGVRPPAPVPVLRLLAGNPVVNEDDLRPARTGGEFDNDRLLPRRGPKTGTLLGRIRLEHCYLMTVTEPVEALPPARR
jgi:hypothetical protein